jgi:NAD(P)-dependent dehydrogenase (short-subunit alcohol dehydrogenase family)
MPTNAGRAPDQLAGITAIVTGAGRGVGQSIALGLAAQGAHVALVARGQKELDETARTIRAAGGSCGVHALDVSSEAQVDALAESLAGESRVPNVLVNAAGTFGPMSFIVDSVPSDWFAAMRVNLFGAYLTSRRFAPAMIAAGWGRILNVTSAGSLHTPGPLNSAYATSKVALNQFTRHLAVELGGTGVTANVFHPGDIKTEMFEDIKAQSEGLPADSLVNYGSWVEWVIRTGGDSPTKAVDLVLRVVGDESYRPNGEFLWIEDPLQPAIPSWTVDDAPPPSYVSGD